MTNDSLCIELHSDVSDWRALQAGAVIVVRRGSLRLDGPMIWLAETPLCPSVLLLEGESYRVPHGGWVRLQAGAGVVVQFEVIGPLSWRARFGRWWSRRAPGQAARGSPDDQANTPAVSVMRPDTSPRWCKVSP